MMELIVTISIFVAGASIVALTVRAVTQFIESCRNPRLHRTRPATVPQMDPPDRDLVRDFCLEKTKAGFRGMKDQHIVEFSPRSISVHRFSALPKGLLINRAPPERKLTINGSTQAFVTQNIPNRIKTGDFTFDDQVTITGPDPMFIGLFDEETRDTLTQLHHCFVEISSKTLRARTRGTFNLSHLRPYATALIDLSHRLAREKPLRHLVLRGVQTETMPHVRIAFLTTLLKNDTNINDFRDELRALLSDRFDRIRFLAAKALRTEGIPTLERILNTNPEMASDVLDILSRMNDPDAIRILKAALTHPTRAVPAIRHVAKRGAEEWIGDLLQILDESRDEETTRAAVNGLALIGSEDAGPHLTGLLATATGELLVEVVDALAICGQADAVEPLNKLVEQDRRRFRDKCRRAIEAIQSRLGDAEHGWLSMETGTALEGAVSPREDDRGRLSFPDERDEQPKGKPHESEQTSR